MAKKKQTQILASVGSDVESEMRRLSAAPQEAVQAAKAARSRAASRRLRSLCPRPARKARGSRKRSDPHGSARDPLSSHCSIPNRLRPDPNSRRVRSRNAALHSFHRHGGGYGLRTTREQAPETRPMRIHRRKFLHLAARGGGRRRCAAGVCARLSDPAGAHHRRLWRRQHARPGVAADRAMAGGAAASALRRRQPGRRRRQYRGRGGRPFRAGWLHAAHLRHLRRDQRHALCQIGFRFSRRFRADRRGDPTADGAAGQSSRSRPRRFPSSSLMPKPIRARSILPRPASARRCMSRSSFSRCRPASMSCTCPIAARRRHSPISWPDRFKPSSSRCRPRSASSGRQIARLGGDQRKAGGSAAGCCRGERGAARLRRHGLGWILRAEGHAAGHRRDARQRLSPPGLPTRRWWQSSRISAARQRRWTPPHSPSSWPPKPQNGPRWSSSPI